MKSIRDFIVFFLILFSIVFLVSNRERIIDILISPIAGEETKLIKMENESLKVEIENLKESILQERGDKIKARIYSNYPFNNRENVVISIGSNDGVEPGMTVLTEGDYLLGKIIDVNEHTSEVQLIFSSDWRESVVIGDQRVQALLTGEGNHLKLDLIPKESVIEEGDRVMNASSEFPLYNLIGSVVNIKRNPNESWVKAEVEIPYDIKEIKDIFVLINFP